jgi:transposase
MTALGFDRAGAADTGWAGYDPRDLLKLYLYGYLNQIRSSGDWKPSAAGMWS